MLGEKVQLISSAIPLYFIIWRNCVRKTSANLQAVRLSNKTMITQYNDNMDEI